jgi:hypothetical protein
MKILPVCDNKCIPEKITSKTYFEQMMRKKKFRIIRYNKGEISFYETKVKTWIGWVSFAVFYKTEIVHILSDPSVRKNMALERINQYCRIKGYNEKDIEIKEINKDIRKKWIFFQRVYSE